MSDTIKSADLAPDERTIQAQLFQWAELQKGSVPELDSLFAVPNGQYRPGQRPEPGLRKGVPDLCLPVSRLGFKGQTREVYGALWIELKTKTGRLRKSQKAWQDRLQEQGQAWALCRSFEGARCCIMDYLDGSFRPDLYEG